MFDNHCGRVGREVRARLLRGQAWSGRWGGTTSGENGRSASFFLSQLRIFALCLIPSILARWTFQYQDMFPRVPIVRPPAPLTMPSPYAPLQCPRSHTQAPADVESNQFISLLINSRCKCDASFWKNINPDAKMTSIRNTAFCKGKGLEPNRGATVCEPAFGRHRGNECIEGPVGGQSGQPMSAAPGACAGVGRRGSGAWLMLFVKVHYLLL